MNNQNKIIGILLITIAVLSYIVWTQHESQKVMAHNLALPQVVAQRQEAQNTPIPSMAMNEPSNQPAPIEPVQQAKLKDPSEWTIEEKRVSAERGAKWLYSKAVTAMRLSAQDEKKLWELLIKYKESGFVASEVYEQEKGTRRAGDFKVMNEIAQSEVVVEIAAAFDENQSKQIKLMLSASRGFTLERNYDQIFDKTGESITPEQSLPLALILTEIYPSPPSGELSPTSRQINPSTGLMPIDEIAFKRMTEVLSARQLAAFMNEKVRRNFALLNSNLAVEMQ